MARREAGLRVSTQDGAFASSDTAVRTLPEDHAGGAINREQGLPLEFASTRFMELGFFNNELLEIGDVLIDISRHGLLEWDILQPYEHPALVWGRDGNIYASVQDSNGVDPTTDSAEAYWKKFLARASKTETNSATSATLLLTPSGLLGLFVASPNSLWRASESKFGLVRFATASEVDAGSVVGRAISPATLRRSELAPKASPTLTGDVGVPTRPRGDNTDNAASTKFVNSAISGLSFSIPNNSVTTSKLVDGSVTTRKLDSGIRGIRKQLHHLSDSNLQISSDLNITLSESRNSFPWLIVVIRRHQAGVEEFLFRTEDLVTSSFSDVKKGYGFWDNNEFSEPIMRMKAGSNSTRIVLRGGAQLRRIQGGSLDVSSPSLTSIYSNAEMWIFGES